MLVASTSRYILFKRYWRLLHKYLGPQRKKVVLLAMLLFGNIGLQLINPQVLRYFIDTATSNGDIKILTTVALLFLVSALVQQMISVFAIYTGEDVGWSATNALRADLLEHCLKLDMPFHNLHAPGELIERVDGDITILTNFFAQFIVRVLGNFFLLLGVLMLLLVINWQAGLVFTIFAITTLILLNQVKEFSTSDWKAARQSSANYFGFLEEHISGLVDVCSNGAQSYMLRRFFLNMRERFITGLRADLKDLVMTVMIILLFVLSQSIALAAAFFLFQNGSVTIGTAFLIVSYSNILFWPLQEITNQMHDFQKASASIARVEELSIISPAIQEGSKIYTTEEALSVNFQNVSFGYNQTDIILHNISFYIQPRQILGLLGRTGSGKTTIARLLLRLYDPTNGAIQLGGVNLQNMRSSSIRTKVGVVTQEVQIFHGTIRDNLTIFDKSISDDKIMSTLHDLELLDWYESLPEGLDTKLSGGGKALSGGEAQLLALARVFLRNPSLVILDEASSRLDSFTEHLIERAIDKLLQGRTAIIIAHRLTTVQRAHQIIILDNGRIHEHGERVYLSRNSNSLYSRLLRSGMDEVLV